MLKKLVVTWGETLINVFVVVGFLIAIIAGIAVMQMSAIGGFILMLVVASSVVLAVYVLYILIDIRDNLKEMNNRERS